MLTPVSAGASVQRVCAAPWLCDRPISWQALRSLVPHSGLGICLTRRRHSWSARAAWARRLTLARAGRQPPVLLQQLQRERMRHHVRQPGRRMRGQHQRPHLHGLHAHDAAGTRAPQGCCSGWCVTCRAVPLFALHVRPDACSARAAMDLPAGECAGGAPGQRHVHAEERCPPELRRIPGRPSLPLKHPAAGGRRRRRAPSCCSLAGTPAGGGGLPRTDVCRPGRANSSCCLHSMAARAGLMPLFSTSWQPGKALQGVGAAWYLEPQDDLGSCP